MKSFIITGIAGFVGSNLAKSLRMNFPDYSIVGVDDFSSGHFKNLIDLDDKILLKENLYDIESMIDKFNVSAVFHQAARTDTTLDDDLYRMDYENFLELLEICKRTRCPLIYASTSAIYGKIASKVKEGEHEQPINSYGFFKLMCDKAAREMTKHGMTSKIVGLRYSNIFGPGEFYKTEHTRSMIIRLYEQIKRGYSPKLFKWGEQKRDWVHVNDVVAANLLALLKATPGIYNIASGKTISFNEIVNSIYNVLKMDVNISYIDNPSPETYQDYTCLDISKAVNDFGYTTQNSNGISSVESYIEYLENLDGERQKT